MGKTISPSESPKIERRHRRWCVMDLVTDPQSGKLRETLLWSNAGKAAALGAFIYEVANARDSDWLWAIVMGVLTAHEVLSRWLSGKLPPIDPQAPK